jgi:hypothetical protein
VRESSIGMRSFARILICTLEQRAEHSPAVHDVGSPIPDARG